MSCGWKKCYTIVADTLWKGGWKGHSWRAGVSRDFDAAWCELLSGGTTKETLRKNTFDDENHFGGQIVPENQSPAFLGDFYIEHIEITPW